MCCLWVQGAAGGTAGATDTGELKGVPALPRCRVELVWEESESEAAAVRRQVREGLEQGPPQIDEFSTAGQVVPCR